MLTKLFYKNLFFSELMEKIFYKRFLYEYKFLRLMTELIITEKPNAAKKIADALADGRAKKLNINKVPYYKLEHNGNDIIVGCAVGHLYGVAEKDKKGWTYPIFNTQWVPTSKINKGSAFTTKYRTALQKLAKEADTFTIATDFDIEGEVIGYNALKFLCKKKDASRMKFSTLTKPDLVKSYETKSPTLEWGQVNAGVTRHEMDWIYGINLSRALTLAIKNATKTFKLLSSGRVQGPALKILVDKEKLIAAFVPEPFWQIQMDGNVKGSEIIANHKEDKFFDKKKVDDIFNKIKAEKEAKISDVTKTQSKTQPPFPFDLTSLQIEAYKTIRTTPKHTLELAQTLYSEGFISYPRTSSQKLPKEIGCKKIIESLKKQDKFKKEADFVLTKTKLIPNEGKKTDAAHPAIYPTGHIPDYEDKKIMDLYELIVRRFLAVFGEPATRETMKIIIDVKDEPFITKGTRTVEQGWFELYGRFVMLKDEELPKVEKGDIIKIKKIDKLDKETQPPKRYTEASIIKELEKRNLGTKATRATIIENLYLRGYITEKAIQATELGIRTCDVLDKYCPEIVDAQLTNEFEEAMQEIREKKKTHDMVIKHVKKVLTKILTTFKKNELKIGEELSKANIETRNVMTHVGKCPNCKDGELALRKGKFGTFIACDKYPDCNTTFSIPAAMVKPTKNICEHCGMPIVTIIKKRKRPQDICINPKCPSKMFQTEEAKKEMEEIESGKLEKTCPKCKKGKLVVRKSIYGAFLGCNNYPKCRYTEKLEEKEQTIDDLEKKQNKD